MIGVLLLDMFKGVVLIWNNLSEAKDGIKILAIDCDTCRPNVYAPEWFLTELLMLELQALVCYYFMFLEWAIIDLVVRFSLDKG